MASVEENKELVRRVIESGVNTGDLEVFRTHLSEDYARHSQATTEMQEIRGIDEMLQFLAEQFDIFPDWHEDIELIIGEGPFVGCVTIGRGTHRGPMGEIPPTDKEIEITNFIFHRIDEGKIAETWIGWDNLAAMAQLGLIGESPAG
ncbi:MAG TPA: ester cyclase [Gemmatimonadota bacterium]|nr:ester cyclase [Gemmatimonadota bacterium]